MKSLSILIILVITMVGISAVKADVYTWIDENGVRHYSDSAPANEGDAKAVFPEYQYDASADKQRAEKDEQEINALIKEIEVEDARDLAEERSRADKAERERKPTQQELIATEKERLENKITFLEEQPLDYFGSQRNKIVRIGYYHYQIQELMQDPDKYFNQPASFEGNVKNPPGSVSDNASGASGY